jgi:4'-phosphopantetheinyl transferase
MPELCQAYSSPTIDLWLLSTQILEPMAHDALKDCLSFTEQAQLQRIRLPAAQRQFLMSRGCLRYLLSRYVSQAPAALTFVYGPKGKPELSLDPDQPGSALRFNLSHSGQRLLIAVSFAVKAIGVDVEALRPVKHLSELCRRHLTATEAERVLALEHPQADHCFLRYWTGKEACLKALGLGIAASMQNLELTLGHDALTSSPNWVAIAAPNLPEHPGQLYQWQPDHEYLAAVAVQSTPLEPGCFRLHQTTPDALVVGTAYP